MNYGTSTTRMRPWDQSRFDHPYWHQKRKRQLSHFAAIRSCLWMIASTPCSQVFPIWHKKFDRYTHPYTDACSGMAFHEYRMLKATSRRRRNSRLTRLDISTSILLRYRPMKAACTCLWPSTEPQNFPTPNCIHERRAWLLVISFHEQLPICRPFWWPTILPGDWRC